ncbi:MAG: DUF1887 family protein, partial [Agathobacter sp.]|nr:DUF1887 family protein [Agathobacter sp.]
MIQIQFLDKNVVSALVPVFSMKPERVIFLYDTKECGENLLKEVAEALKSRMPKLEIQYERTNMLSIEEVRGELENLIKVFGNREIQIEITGGTEVMTACGLMAAREHNLTATYVDFYSKHIINIFTRERLAEIRHVTLADYLTAIGGKYMSSSRHTPEEKDYERILSMAKVIFSNEKKWDKFFTHMTHGFSAKGVMDFSMGENKDDRDCQFILDAFLERGFAKKIGEDRYRFNSEADKEYMTVSGIWLEAYVYIQAKQCFDEVYMGVDIDWNKRDICESRDNEIDVVIMKNSQPIFISCKMRPIEKETVYEIYAMAKRLGGNLGRALIATTFDVRSGKDERNSIYLRMAKMKVGLIESKDFIRQNPSEVFT